MSIFDNIRGLFKRGATGTASTYEWWAKNFVGVGNTEVAITPMSSLASATVYSAVKRISSTLSSVPFNVYEKTGDNRRLAGNHDQYYLLKNEPSPLYSSTVCRATLAVNYLLWGNGYLEIIRNTFGRPIRYDLISPKIVEVQFIEKAKVRYKISEPKVRYIDSSDMIHISDMNLDGVTGMSKISLAKGTIGTSLNGEQLRNNFYKNGSHIGGWLEFVGTVKDEDLAKLQKSWKKVNGGINNTGNIAILDKGTKYHSHAITMPFSDMEYVESQKFQVADIARIFNIPPHLVGDLTRSSFSNIEQQSIDYIENTILPIAVMIEQEFNRKIFRIRERGKFYVKLELKGLLRGDLAAQTDFTTNNFDRGIFSINEVRAFYDMNPIPNGDVRFVPLNFTTLDKAIKDEEQAV